MFSFFPGPKCFREVRLSRRDLYPPGKMGEMWVGGSSFFFLKCTKRSMLLGRGTLGFSKEISHTLVLVKKGVSLWHFFTVVQTKQDECTGAIKMHTQRNTFRTPWRLKMDWRFSQAFRMSSLERKKLTNCWNIAGFSVTKHAKRMTQKDRLKVDIRQNRVAICFKKVFWQTWQFQCESFSHTLLVRERLKRSSVGEKKNLFWAEIFSSAASSTGHFAVKMPVNQCCFVILFALRFKLWKVWLCLNLSEIAGLELFYSFLVTRGLNYACV